MSRLEWVQCIAGCCDPHKVGISLQRCVEPDRIGHLGNETHVSNVGRIAPKEGGCRIGHGLQCDKTLLYPVAIPVIACSLRDSEDGLQIFEDAQIVDGMNIRRDEIGHGKSVCPAFGIDRNELRALLRRIQPVDDGKALRQPKVPNFEHGHKALGIPGHIIWCALRAIQQIGVNGLIGKALQIEGDTDPEAG